MSAMSANLGARVWRGAIGKEKLPGRRLLGSLLPRHGQGGPEPPKLASGIGNKEPPGPLGPRWAPGAKSTSSVLLLFSAASATPCRALTASFSYDRSEALAFCASLSFVLRASSSSLASNSQRSQKH